MLKKLLNLINDRKAEGNDCLLRHLPSEEEGEFPINLMSIMLYVLGEKLVSGCTDEICENANQAKNRQTSECNDLKIPPSNLAWQICGQH